MALVEHATNAISERAIGAAIEVHRQLGPGLLESSYHGCLCEELDLRRIAYRTEVPLSLRYKGKRLVKGYVVDVIIEDALIVEIKSVEKLLPLHSAPLMTYLRLTGLTAGLLINFNVEMLPQGIRRIIRG